MNWKPEDRAKTLAHLLEDAARCQMCGTAEWEWQEDMRAYEPMHKFCRGCYYKDVASEDSDLLAGTTVVLIPSSQVTDEMREADLRRLRESQ